MRMDVSLLARPTPLLAVLVIVWLIVEGRTIGVAIGSALPGGARRLSRLGAWFLGSEAWTLALLGSAHGLIPAATHRVMGEVGWGLALFVTGWMLRDLGLWLGPRSASATRNRWRATVATGAVTQLVGLVAVAAGWVLVAPDPMPGAGAAMLQNLLPPVLVLGGLLLVLLHRLPPAGYFCWTDPPGRLIHR